MTAISDLITALGGDTVVKGAYDDDLNVAVTSAKVDSWGDARGTSGFGPSLVGQTGGGANKPAYTSGSGITTDGTNYLATAAAFAGFDIGVPMWIATISTYNAAGFGFESALQDIAPSGTVPSRWLAASDANQSTICLQYGASSSGTTLPNAGTGATPKSANLRLTVAYRTDFQGLWTEQSNARYGYEVAGRLRKFQEAGQVTGSNFLTYGYAVTQKAGNRVRAIIVCAGYPTQAQMLALKTYAATKGYVIDTTTYTKGWSAIGDSNTRGFGTTTPATDNWVAQMFSAHSGALALYEMGNYGVDGRRAADIKLLAPRDVHPQLGTFRTQDYVSYWAGTNDVSDTSRTSAQIITDIKAELTVLRATGAKVVLLTPIPRGDAALSTKTATLQAIADDMKNNPGTYDADYVVQLSSDAKFNDFTFSTGDHTNTTYYQADKIHLTAAGHLAVADLVWSTVFAGPTADHLTITTQPSSPIATGAAHATQPVVALKDSGGTTVTTETSTVTAALIVETGSATPLGTLTKAAVAGVANFSGNGLGATSAGGATAHWRFTSGTLTLADSATFTITGAATPPPPGAPFLTIAGIVVPVLEGQAIEQLEQGGSAQRAQAGNLLSDCPWEKLSWQLSTGLLTITEAVALKAAIAFRARVTVAGLVPNTTVTCEATWSNGAYINTSTADGTGILRSLVLTLRQV